MAEQKMHIIPTLSLEKADQAIELYKKAFGAVEEHRLLCPETGAVVHCGLKVGESALFITEANPETGCAPSIGLRAHRRGCG